MAARRQIPPQTDYKEPLETYDPSPAIAESSSSSTTPSVPTSTIVKLAFFTVCMFAAPLGAYFLSVRTIFAGNTTYAGALAAFVANVVLVAYIVVAVLEDQGGDMEIKGRRGPGKKEKGKGE